MTNLEWLLSLNKEEAHQKYEAMEGKLCFRDWYERADDTHDLLMWLNTEKAYVVDLKKEEAVKLLALVGITETDGEDEICSIDVEYAIKTIIKRSQGGAKE